MAAPVEDIRALKPFLGAGPDWGAIVVLLAVALLAAAALAYWRRRPRPPARAAATAAPGPLAAPLTLRGRLAALADSGLAERGEAGAFCEQLSEIMRDFVAQRYGISSKRLTSSELLAELERQGVGITVREPLESVFAGLDLVKFAKVRLSAPELRQLLTTATLVLDLAGRGGEG